MARLNPQLIALKGRPAAVATLAGGATVPEAAAAAGVGVRSVARWRTDPTFQAEVRDARRALLDQAAGKLASRMASAADVLSTIAEDAEQSAVVRVRAAAAVLDVALKLADALDLADRLSAIEARIEAMEAARTPTHERDWAA